MAEFEYQLFCNEHLEDEVQDYHPSSQQPIDVESSMLRDQFAALWGDDSESDEAVEEWTRLREQECKLLPVVKDEGWGITLSERATVISIMYEIIGACQLGFQTRMLAVNIFDRFILTLRGQCQERPLLLAMACVLLAAKLQEIGFETKLVRHILLRFSRTLDFDELAFTEARVTKAIEFRLSACTTASLFEALGHMVAPEFQAIFGDRLDLLEEHVEQLCAAAYLDANFATQRPSNVALAIMQITMLQFGLSVSELRGLLCPAFKTLTLLNLAEVTKLTNYLNQMIQPSPCSSQKSFREEPNHHEQTSRDESPLKRHKAGYMTPSSILCLETSPFSEVESLPCSEPTESPLSLCEVEKPQQPKREPKTEEDREVTQNFLVRNQGM